VLIFSRKEKDPLVLFAPGNGAVTALDINEQFALVGYSEGGVCLFNLLKC